MVDMIVIILWACKKTFLAVLLSENKIFVKVCQANVAIKPFMNKGL